jgi:hypothetical protein
MKKGKNKYSVEQVFEDLKRKKASVSFNGVVYIIDISKAESIGNKSWGKIEYLIKYHGAQLIGRLTYSKKFHTQTEEKPIIMKECIMKTNCI